MKSKLFSTTIATLFVVACSSSEVNSPRTSGTVTSVSDGDTIKVQTDTNVITVRLACIDAPETAQKPWGKLASDRLKELLPIGDPVELRVVKTDQDGRTVAEVFWHNNNANLQMVKEGQAVVYQQYLEGCFQNKNQYLQAELDIQQQRLNFWSQDNPVMPWDFRQGKTANSQPESVTTQPVTEKESVTESNLESGDRYISGENHIGAFSEASLKRAINFASQGDNEAFLKLVINGEIFKLPSGKKVYLEECVGTFCSIVRVRFEGDLTSFYTTNEAVSKR